MIAAFGLGVLTSTLLASFTLGASETRLVGVLAFAAMLPGTAGLSFSFDVVETLENCRERLIEAIFSLRERCFSWDCILVIREIENDEEIFLKCLEYVTSV